METVEHVVEQAVESVVEEVKAVVKPEVVQITEVEQLAMAMIERTFLKAQVELQSLAARTKELQDQAQKASVDYMNKGKEIMVKYGIEEAEYIFDNLTMVFRKKPTPQGQAQAQSNG